MIGNQVFEGMVLSAPMKKFGYDTLSDIGTGSWLFTDCTWISLCGCAKGKIGPQHHSVHHAEYGCVGSYAKSQT